jgi:hypothetical protein
MGTYLAASVREHLNEVQMELDLHLVTGPDGRCRSCGDVEPCRERGRLEAVFARYDELPRRRPGMTGTGVRESAVSGRPSWFAVG